MNRIIFRYLTKETYLTMLAVTAILVLIFMCNQFVRYLGDAAVGRLTPQAVLQMMCIQVPLLLGFMLPLGFFLGILLAFGRLYVDNEMTVLTACGVSPGQILCMSLGFATIVAAGVAILMLWIEPKMAWYRNHIIAKVAIASPIERISPGRFQYIGDWVLYAGSQSRDRQTMENVFAAVTPDYSNPNQPSINIITGKKAFQKVTKEGNFLVLTDGQRYVGTPGKNKYQIVQFGEYGVRLADQLPQMRKLEEFMSMSELWHIRKKNRKAEAEFQWRISMPISVLILTLFAVPLSQVKPRQGRFAQLLPAIIVYIIYIDLLFLTQAWIEKGKISSALGMWWIHGLMFLSAVTIIHFKLPVLLKLQRRTQ